MLLLHRTIYPGAIRESEAAGLDHNLRM